MLTGARASMVGSSSTMVTWEPKAWNMPSPMVLGQLDPEIKGTFGAITEVGCDEDSGDPWRSHDVPPRRIED